MSDFNASVLFVGDPHGYYDDLLQVIEAHNPEAIIFLGDMTFEKPADDIIGPLAPRTWYIHGNHDCDREHWYDNLFASSLRNKNLHCNVENICGLRVAGLGGVFRHKVWSPPNEPRYKTRDEFLTQIRPANRWRNGLPVKQRASIFPEDIEHLSRIRADILITHEAPSTHEHGFSILDDVADKMGVSHIIHGHHHIDYGKNLADGVQVLGVADGSISQLDGTLIHRRSK